MKRILISIVFITTCFLAGCRVYAQSFEEFRRQSIASFEQNRRKSQNDFDEFRRKSNEEYAGYLKNIWKLAAGESPIPVPKEEKVVPPLVFVPEMDENEPDVPVVVEPVNVVPVTISVPTIAQQPTIAPQPETAPVVSPEPVVTPSPEPVVAPSPKPAPAPVIEGPFIRFDWYGTPVIVRYPACTFPILASTKEKDVAAMWSALSAKKYDVIVESCEKVRRDLSLPDWTYVDFVCEVAGRLLSGTEARTVMQLFILSNSGLAVLPGRTESGKLYLMVNTDCNIYDHNSWTVGGKRYYLTVKDDISSLYVFDRVFGENPAKMVISTPASVGGQQCSVRTLQARDYPQMKVDVHSNCDIVNLLGDYPVVYSGTSTSSRWVMHANTPVEEGVRFSMYPQLQAALEGHSHEDKVQMLLNFVQTAFEYEYDDVVWGEDRTFYCEETLFYPYCDCEDRSVLFSRLVRDLVGLDVALIHYPGHLATAVNFPQPVDGDALLVGGRRYVICDPTYIGAPVGETMPDMDNSTAEVILLD